MENNYHIERKRLQRITKEQEIFLRKTLFETTNLEFFLRKCHQLAPYSIRNVLLMIAQSNGQASECKGVDGWRKKGVKVLPGANPMKIFAPNEKGAWSITNVYDVCNTDGVREEQLLPTPEYHMQLLSRLLQKTVGWNLEIVKFRPDFKKMTAKNNTRKTVYIRDDLSPRIQAVLAIREICILTMSKDCLQGKRVPMTEEKTMAFATVAAFEIADWLKENPPKIPNKVKEILLNEGEFLDNLKDINRVAYQLIKELKNILSVAYAKEEEKMAKV